MRQRPYRLLTSLMISVALGGCASEAPEKPNSNSDDPFASLAENLTPLATQCTFVASSGLMTVTIAAGETAIISKRAADSAILQNGAPCDNAVTSGTLKRIEVTATGNNDTLVLDFTNGVFATGTSSAATTGIDVDMGAGTGGVFGIRGQNAADTMTFGADAITVNADNYKDVVVAGAETYTVYLGNGNDTFSAAGSTPTGALFGAALTVYGGPGNDTFLQGSAATPDETLWGGDGTDTVSYASRIAPLTITAGTAKNDGDPAGAGEDDEIKSDIEVVTGGSAIDTMTGTDGFAITFNGGGADDILTGADGNDTLNGDGDNDTLIGKDGDDVLNGGAGNDTFDEEAADNGSDTFNGGAGIDVVDYSGRGVGVIVTMDGKTANDGEDGEDDNVKGDVEDLIGTDEVDDITGNALANVITGGLENDELDGAAGDDVFYQDSDDDGDDNIVGGLGVDTVDYSDRTDPVHATLDGATASGKYDDVGLAMLEGDTLALDIENLMGGADADVLTGNSLNNELAGGAGIDTLVGLDGDDVLDGGGQADVLTCGNGHGDIGLNGTGAKTNCEF
ncbi:MAG TPA: calcium-binding protein [Polyangiaceae bacterium]